MLQVNSTLFGQAKMLERGALLYTDTWRWRWRLVWCGFAGVSMLSLCVLALYRVMDFRLSGPCYQTDKISDVDTCYRSRSE